MRVELLFSPELRHLEEIRNEMTETIKVLAGDNEWNYMVVLAFEEALVNIIEHGYKDRARKTPIKLIMNKTRRKLTIRMIDKGKPFDLTKVPDVNIDLHHQNYEKRGLGIYLIKRVASRLKYTTNKNRENILMMEKDL